MIDAGDGEIDYTRSGRLLTSVQSTQRAQAEALASHDFRKRWAASTKAPIDFLGNRLGQASQPELKLIYFTNKPKLLLSCANE